MCSTNIIKILYIVFYLVFNICSSFVANASDVDNTSTNNNTGDDGVNEDNEDSVNNCSEQSIKIIENYLNQLNNIKANFKQVEDVRFASDDDINDSSNPENNDNKNVDANVEKSQAGILYLSKPKKLKWEYTSPKHYMILVNDNTIIYHDYDLNETTTIPNKNPIIRLLTAKKITLSKMPNKNVRNKNTENILIENDENTVYLKMCAESENIYDVLLSYPHGETLHGDLNVDLWIRFVKKDIVQEKKNQNQKRKIKSKEISTINTISSVGEDGTIINELKIEDIEYGISFDKDTFVFKNPKFYTDISNTDITDNIDIKDE